MVRKPTIRQIASEIGRGGRSGLYLWMWDNFDEIRSARIGRHGGWSRAINQLTQLGFKSKDGSPLKPRNVRMMFKRVIADKANAVPKPAPPTPRTPDAPRSPSAGFEHDPNLPEDDIRRWLDGEK